MISNASRTRGFTLVELMVSMLAGLIIAMAVVALSREVTNSFHEESRVATTEMSLRLASDRLRADLLRAGFGSTSNIRFDPKMAVDRSGIKQWQNYSNASITNLAGVYLVRDGSKATTEGDFTYATRNGLSPDSIELSGNFTSADDYGATVANFTGGCNGGALIRLNPTDPAVLRIVSAGDAGGNAATTLSDIFAPGLSTAKYMARVTDKAGCYHIAPVCGTTINGVDDAGRPVAFVQLDGANSVLPNTNASGRCGVGSFAEPVQISPIQRVRWEVKRNVNPILLPSANNHPDAKFDLYRSWIDVDGAVVGAPELVAEYMIDMKFALTVDDRNISALATDGTTDVANAVAAGIKSYDFLESTESSLFGDKPPAPGTGSSTATKGPHRIRSVQFRLAARAAVADRAAPIDTGNTGYLFRYCLSTTAPCTEYARVRTVSSEVTLQNHARLF